MFRHFLCLRISDRTLSKRGAALLCRTACEAVAREILLLPGAAATFFSSPLTRPRLARAGGEGRTNQRSGAAALQARSTRFSGPAVAEPKRLAVNFGRCGCEGGIKEPLPQRTFAKIEAPMRCTGREDPESRLTPLRPFLAGAAKYSRKKTATPTAESPGLVEMTSHLLPLILAASFEVIGILNPDLYRPNCSLRALRKTCKTEL